MKWFWDWYTRRQARKAYKQLYAFHSLNMHLFDATEYAHLVLTLDKIRSVMYKDWNK